MNAPTEGLVNGMLLNLGHMNVPIKGLVNGMS